MTLTAEPQHTASSVTDTVVDAAAGRKSRPHMTRRWTSLLWFQRLRSGLYAFFFAPIAFLAMGLGVISLEFESAVGQPLSSSEGFVSMVIATCMLCTILINDGSSGIGMIVTLVWSIVIGIAQFFGFSGWMTDLVSGVNSADSAATMQWGLYPIAVMAIVGGATMATYWVQSHARLLAESEALAKRSAPVPPDSDQVAPAEGAEPALTSGEAPTWDGVLETDSCDASRHMKHQSVRNMVVVSSIILTCVAGLIYVVVAPDDTLNVAAYGLKGLPTSQGGSILLALLGALLLAITAFSSAFSSVGPLIGACLVMVVPCYFVYPMWASLTGNVATPGQSLSTSFALASPLITALGLTLAAAAFGVFMTRRNIQLRIAHAHH